MIVAGDHLKAGHDQVYLVTASDDKTIKLFDLRTGRCVRTLQGHNHFVQSISVDSTKLVSGGVDNQIKVWQ